MIRKTFTAALFAGMALTAAAQERDADTVIVSLAKTSKLVFTIQDRSDLEILRHYNFQDLFNDILRQIEAKSDTAAEWPVSKEGEWTNPPADADLVSRNDDDDNDGSDDDGWSQTTSRRDRPVRTWQSTNFELGTNNYITDTREFPDASNAPYAVRPFGSWYVAANSIQRTRVTRGIFLEWGLGVSWYNFKFQNKNLMIGKMDDGLIFTPDTRDLDHIKSKLTASYINASLVPVIDFGDHSRKPRLWDGYGSEFRIGFGPYVGYKIGSKSKLVYFDDDGDREREKTRDGFYLNNLRYGARIQLGFRSTDFFLNYDLNELFVEGKGPRLNAVSFGFIL